MKYFDPGDLITPLGLHDRHLRDDGQGAVLWLEGLYEHGVSIRFSGIRGVLHPPGPHDETPAEMEVPDLTVVGGFERHRLPALRSQVSSAGGVMYRLDGTYYVPVDDRSSVLTYRIAFLDVALSIECSADGLGSGGA